MLLFSSYHGDRLGRRHRVVLEVQKGMQELTFSEPGSEEELRLCSIMCLKYVNDSIPTVGGLGVTSVLVWRLREGVGRWGALFLSSCLGARGGCVAVFLWCDLAELRVGAACPVTRARWHCGHCLCAHGEGGTCPCMCEHGRGRRNHPLLFLFSSSSSSSPPPLILPPPCGMDSPAATRRESLASSDGIRLSCSKGEWASSHASSSVTSKPNASPTVGGLGVTSVLVWRLRGGGGAPLEHLKEKKKEQVALQIIEDGTRPGGLEPISSSRKRNNNETPPVRLPSSGTSQVKWGEADLIALQRWSHEDHWPHRGHHVVGRDVFLPEIGEDDRRGTGSEGAGDEAVPGARLHADTPRGPPLLTGLNPTVYWCMNQPTPIAYV
ncbi:hypothetical protein INR49_017144 [Caranx melampygus]|nr:hypothetical protein INR49_017144 [Caranx melampygus]